MTDKADSSKPGSTCSEYAVLRQLEETRMLQITHFIGTHGPVSKKEIYDAIGYSPRMPSKIDSLIDMGLIFSTKDFGRVEYMVTDCGRLVSKHIGSIMKALSSD